MRPTGLVAMRIVPTQNAVMDMSMMKPGWSLLRRKPVDTAAIAPEIAAGLFLTAVRRMELRSRTSWNCLWYVSSVQLEETGCLPVVVDPDAEACPTCCNTSKDKIGVSGEGCRRQEGMTCAKPLPEHERHHE